MRKNVLALVMAAFAFSTLGAFAQNEVQSNTPVCEQSSSCKKDGKDKKCKGKGERKHCKKNRISPFEGIELTAQQQQQLDALKAECKSQKEADKKIREESRALKSQQFDNKVAEILTPEQYTIYKANQERIAHQKKDMKKRVEKVRDGKKGQKPMEGKKDNLKK